MVVTGDRIVTCLYLLQSVSLLERRWNSLYWELMVSVHEIFLGKTIEYWLKLKITFHKTKIKV